MRTPASVILRPANFLSRLRTASESEAERAASKRNCTALSTLFTFCPPGPDARTNPLRFRFAFLKYRFELRELRIGERLVLNAVGVDINVQRGLFKPACTASTATPASLTTFKLPFSAVSRVSATTSAQVRAQARHTVAALFRAACIASAFLLVRFTRHTVTRHELIERIAQPYHGLISISMLKICVAETGVRRRP
jgi:hypothetical protein